MMQDQFSIIPDHAPPGHGTPESTRNILSRLKDLPCSVAACAPGEVLQERASASKRSSIPAEVCAPIGKAQP